MTRTHRLAARRIRLGLTQADLAQRAGIKYATYVGLAEAVDAGKSSTLSMSPATARRYIDACRRALVDLEHQIRAEREDRRRKAEWLKQEEKRIAFQRSLWHALPDHPSVRALKAAMLDRALDLMHEGNGEATDALAEFLPEGDVDRMFACWEAEVFADRNCSGCAPEPVSLSATPTLAGPAPSPPAACAPAHESPRAVPAAS